MPFHPTLFAIRGLPGSGKSSLGALLGNAIAADDYFMDKDDGIYRFDPSKLGAAHADCLQRAQRILILGFDIAVCNTFSQRWELEPYIAAAAAVYPVPARLVVMDLYDRGPGGRHQPHEAPLGARLESGKSESSPMVGTHHPERG